MNYPINNSETNYKNRGMTLEHDINESNKYYLANDIGVIYKHPTPISIKKVNSKNIITEAYYSTKSTTDYNGIYKGKYIDFEAKETKNKIYFPLNNIHPHQLKHLEKISSHGGIGFIIVSFTSINEIYLIDIKYILKINDDLKNIPLDYFKKYGHIIKETYIPKIDYLKIIDEIYFSNKEDYL